MFDYGDECEPDACFQIYSLTCVETIPGGVVSTNGDPYSAITLDFPEQMTWETCARACAQTFYGGILYVGIINGTVCTCGTSYLEPPLSSNCTTPCEGNPDENCGGMCDTNYV